MKALAIATLSLAATLQASAEPAEQRERSPEDVRIAQQQEAMRKFDWMDGEWRGDAFVTTANGRRKILQTERVGPMLNGTVKVIEGKGTASDGTVAFNALAIVSYEPDSKTYTWRSYAWPRGHLPRRPRVRASI